MIQSIIEKVADYVGCASDILFHLAEDAPRTYRQYRIPKKTNGTRTIFHPSKQTKMLQYAIMDVVLCRLPVHVTATGYRHGIKSPLRKTATRHCNFRYSVRIDIRDFFSTIRPIDILALPQLREMNLSTDDIKFLTNSLFVRVSESTWGLAVGAPSSPMISNAVMFSLDKKLASIAYNLRGVYTRYADDMVFSTNIKGLCNNFLQEVKQALESTASPSLQINSDKTCFMSRGTRRMIAGLIVGTTGSVTIGRKNKRYIKKLVWNHKNGNLAPHLLSYLHGYIAFVRDVEPSFYTMLQTKYGKELIISLSCPCKQ